MESGFHCVYVDFTSAYKFNRRLTGLGSSGFRIVVFVGGILPRECGIWFCGGGGEDVIIEQVCLTSY